MAAPTPHEDGDAIREALVARLAVMLSLIDGKPDEDVEIEVEPDVLRQLYSLVLDHRAALTAAVAERDEARREQQESEAAVDALTAKLDALAPHGTCACSYDRIGDVCLHHSPALTAAHADSARLREALTVAMHRMEVASVDWIIAAALTSDRLSHSEDMDKWAKDARAALDAHREEGRDG